MTEFDEVDKKDNEQIQDFIMNSPYLFFICLPFTSLINIMKIFESIFNYFVVMLESWECAARIVGCLFGWVCFIILMIVYFSG